jgi:hypothetical protein
VRGGSAFSLVVFLLPTAQPPPPSMMRLRLSIRCWTTGMCQAIRSSGVMFPFWKKVRIATSRGR